MGILYWLAVRRSVVHRCSNLSRKLNGFDYLIAKPSPLQDVPFGRHHAAACFVFKSLVCILSLVRSRTSPSPQLAAATQTAERRQAVPLLHPLYLEPPVHFEPRVLTYLRLG